MENKDDMPAILIVACLALVALFLLVFGAVLELTYPFPHYENVTRCTPLWQNQWILGIPYCPDVYCNSEGAVGC